MSAGHGMGEHRRHNISSTQIRCQQEKKRDFDCRVYFAQTLDAAGIHSMHAEEAP